MNENCSKSLGGINHSESDDCSYDENEGDTEAETNNERYECKFDLENGIECAANIEKINFKETCSEK